MLSVLAPMFKALERCARVGLAYRGGFLVEEVFFFLVRTFFVIFVGFFFSEESPLLRIEGM